MADPIFNDAAILENAPPAGSTLTEQDRYNIEKAGPDGLVNLDAPVPAFEYVPGSKPSPWSELEKTPVLAEADTAAKLKAFNTHARRVDLWMKTQEGYTPKDRAAITEKIRAKRAEIAGAETFREKVSGLGDAFVDSAIGSVAALPIAAGSQFDEESRKTFYDMAGASTSKAIDYVTKQVLDREVPELSKERFDALVAEGFTPKTDNQKRIGQFIDRREKLDGAVASFKDDLDKGNFPDEPAQFQSWLKERQTGILSEAQKFNGDKDDYTADPSRKFETDLDLVNSLAEYTATRDDRAFNAMAQQMVRSSDRAKADSKYSKAFETGGGLIAGIREADKAQTGGTETAELLTQAATDPVELASTAISAVLTGGTAKALAATTKAGRRATAGVNTAIDVALEAGTEAFQSKVEDPNASAGEAAAAGALVGLAFQLTGAALGVTKRRIAGTGDRPAGVNSEAIAPPSRSDSPESEIQAPLPSTNETQIAPVQGPEITTGGEEVNTPDTPSVDPSLTDPNPVAPEAVVPPQVSPTPLDAAPNPVESTPEPAVDETGRNFGPGAANVDEDLGAIPEGYAESGSYRTIKDAIDRGDFAPGIEDFLPSLYETESRREWVDQAVAELGQEGEAAGTANVMKAFQEGTQKPKDTAKLTLLLKNYEVRRKIAEAEGNRSEENRLAMLQQDLLSVYMEGQTDIARILNSGYLIRHLSPDGQIRALIQATNRIGKKKKVKSQGEDAEISSAAGEAIERTRKKKGTKPEDDASGVKERQSERAATDSEGRVSNLLDWILKQVSDTPDLRQNPRKQSALTKFLNDSRSHAKGSEKFPGRSEFLDTANQVGVAAEQAESLWNAVTKAYGDAKTFDRIKADLVAQRKARRDALISALNRQFGKARADKIFKKKSKMIDALLDGERPEKAIDDFYSAVDLSPENRARVLDILEKAEKSQGAIQATMLDEAKQIISQSMPPQSVDALLDSFLGSIFSGLGTQAISILGTTEGTLTNLVGHLVTDIQKAKSEGVAFGRTRAALKGLGDKNTVARAVTAFKSVLYDLPIDDQVSRFGAGNALASLMKRDDVPVIFWPWLAQHYVFRVMGMIDQTLKSFVFRSEAGVLAYEDAIESGLSPKEATKAVIDQSAKFAKTIWDADRLTAQAEYRRSMGAEPTTAKENALIDLRALEIMEKRMKPEVRESASERGSSFNLMGAQPEDWLGHVAKSFTKMVNVGFPSKYGEVRPLRFIVPVVNVLFNGFRVAAEYTPLGYFAGHNPVHSYDRQKLAMNRMRAGLALSASALTLASLSDSLDDEEGEGPFRFRIHGKGPKDRDLKSALMAKGWRPFSLEIRLPGQERSVFKRYGEGPMLLSLALMGGAFDALRYGDVTPEEFTDYAGTIAPALADAFALLGEIGPAKTISEASGLLSGEEAFGKTGLERLITSLGNVATGVSIPFSSLFRDVANMVDPRITNKTEASGPLREVIPGTKSSGEVLIDQFGQEIKRPRLKATERFVSVEPNDPLLDLLNKNGVALDAMVKSGSNDASMRPASADATQIKVYEMFVRNGNPQHMTREQYVTYFKEHRQKLRAYLDANLPSLSELDPEKLEEVVTEAKTIFSNGQKVRMMGRGALAEAYEKIRAAALLR